MILNIFLILGAILIGVHALRLLANSIYQIRTGTYLWNGKVRETTVYLIIFNLIEAFAIIVFLAASIHHLWFL